MREGLLTVVALLVTGCIFAEPPERNPRRTPVFLDVAAAEPPVTQIIVFGQQDPPIEFSVPVRSEDVGEEIWWSAFQNLGLTSSPRSIVANKLPPSTIIDTTRKITFSFRPELNSPSCFQITVNACHESSFVFGDFYCREDAHEDTALATWWINFGSVDDPPSLAECPQPGSVAP